MSIKLGAFGFQCSCKYVKLYVSVSETRFSVLSAGAEREGKDMHHDATAIVDRVRHRLLGWASASQARNWVNAIKG